MTFIAHAFDALPHVTCLANRPWLLWPSVIADAFIALAYFAVPIILWRAAHRGGDGGLFPARWITVLFCTFILSCGVTHVLGIVTIWWPFWTLSNVAKAITAAGSVTTAVALRSAAARFLAWQSATQALRDEQERAAAAIRPDSPADLVRLVGAVRRVEDAVGGLNR